VSFYLFKAGVRFVMLFIYCRETELLEQSARTDAELEQIQECFSDLQECFSACIKALFYLFKAGVLFVMLFIYCREMGRLEKSARTDAELAQIRRNNHTYEEPPSKIANLPDRSS
jgi:uncharacterized membrane protein